MRQVRLEGRTKKGRERIKQHGDVWVVDARWSGTDRSLVRSVKTEDWRWIWTGAIGEDPDFRIVETMEV